MNCSVIAATNALNDMATEGVVGPTDLIRSTGERPSCASKSRSSTRRTPIICLYGDHLESPTQSMPPPPQTPNECNTSSPPTSPAQSFGVVLTNRRSKESTNDGWFRGDLSQRAQRQKAYEHSQARLYSAHMKDYAKTFATPENHLKMLCALVGEARRQREQQRMKRTRDSVNQADISCGLHDAECNDIFSRIRAASEALAKSDDATAYPRDPYGELLRHIASRALFLSIPS